MTQFAPQNGFYLTLIRHAKSSWKDLALADFDRPLNGRGKKAAPAMGELLASFGYYFDGFYSSPARRAAETAEQIAAKIGFEQQRIKYSGELYTFESRELLQFIRTLDDKERSVALVGHNPGLTHLANDLSLSAIENIPTCGVVCLRCSINAWDELGYGAGELFAFEYPKKHFNSL